MLETAERFTDHEGEPAVQQYLLLVGGLRTLAAGEHDPRLVLDAFLLRSLAVNGYAPSFDDCAKCGMPGPNRFFSVAAGRSRVRRTAGCRAASYPPRSRWSCSARCSPATGRPRTRCEAAARREGSGLVAAYLQWHLERGLRSLRFVEK